MLVCFQSVLVTERKGQNKFNKKKADPGKQEGSTRGARAQPVTP